MLAGNDVIGLDERKGLKVMHIITHLDLGGAEGVAIQLIEGLAPQADSAIFAVLETKAPTEIGADMARRARELGVPVIYGTRHGFKSGGVVQAAWRLARAIDTAAPDVLHVHTEIPELTLAVACALFPRVSRVPLLRTVHNSVLWIDWTRMGAWVTRRLGHGRAVAVSRSAAQADAAIQAGIARPDAEVIYNAVASTRDARPPAGPDRAPLRVLFAGRLVHQKGADLLPAIIAQAQARMVDRHREVEVIVAGDGALHGELAAAFAAMAGPWRVTMIPPIANLSAHLDAYDVALLPSRFEGFGLLHLEVLMAGLPLVTCQAPGLDEVLPQAYCLSTPVADVDALASALARVIGNLEPYRDAVAASRPMLADRFAPSRMMNRYLEQYRGLAGVEMTV